MKSVQEHGRTQERSVFLTASSFTVTGMDMATLTDEIEPIPYRHDDHMDVPTRVFCYEIGVPDMLSPKEQARNRLNYKMEQWVADVPTMRFTQGGYSLQKAHLQLLGRGIGEAIVDFRAGGKYISTIQNRIAYLINGVNLVDMIKDRTSIVQQLVFKLNEIDGFNLQVCGNCVQVHTEGGMEDDNGDEICNSCANNHHNWSDIMECYVLHSRGVRYYPTERSWNNDDAEHVSSDWVDEHRNSMWWSDQHDAYIHNDIYIAEDNDDDEEERDNDGLNEYHSTSRRFYVHQLNPNSIFQSMPPLGLEIEVYADDRNDAVESLRNLQTIGNLILERDGSLSNEHGFEIITDPLGYEEWKAMGPMLCNHLKKSDCVAYNHPDAENNYGIHVNVDRNYLSPLQEARLFLFLTAVENFNFVRAIAQRNSIYAARADIGSMEKKQQTVAHSGGLCNTHTDKGYRKKIIGLGKYAPLHFHDNLAEFRLFQSTLHIPSFMKNVELIWALVEWVRSSSGSAWQHEDFVKWLGKRGNARKDYPNLYDYLIRPTYRIKKSSSSIINTWAKHLPIPNPVKGILYVPPQPANDQMVAAA